MTDTAMLKKQIGLQATRLGECIRKINQLTSDLHHAREENKRFREALTTIGHSLVCAPIDYAEHNAGELLRAGNIARAALTQEKQT